MRPIFAASVALIIGAVGCAKSSAPAPSTVPPTSTPSLNAALPSIFIAGDSTAARGAGARQQGWGVPFADYFDPTKVNVVNRARGGRSSRTFISEGLWDKLLADVKARRHRADPVRPQRRRRDQRQPRAARLAPGLGEETARDRQPAHEDSTRSCTRSAGTCAR